MGFIFNDPKFIIGTNDIPSPIQMLKSFVIGGAVNEPTWQDVVISGVGALTLVNAKADSLEYLKLFGENRMNGIPTAYTQTKYTANTSSTDNIATNITWDVDDIELEIEVYIPTASDSFYLLQSRRASGQPIYGITGSASGSTIQGLINGSGATSDITRTAGHTYRINMKAKSGNLTLYVKDLTSGTEATNTGTYTWAAYAYVIRLWGNNVGGQSLSANHRVKYVKIYKSGNLVLDWIPIKDGDGKAGFWEGVTRQAQRMSTNLTAGADFSPTTDYPVEYWCNNGRIRFRHQSKLPLGYKLIESLRCSGEINLGFKTTNNSRLECSFKRVLGSGNAYVYASDSSSSTTTNTTAYSQASGGGYWRFGNNAISNNTSTLTTYTTVQDSSGVTINGTFKEYEDGVGTFTSSSNLKVLGTNTAIALQSLKHYDNGVLTSHILPAKRESDNRNGVYDIVRDIFYPTPSNSTVYTGSAVNDPIKLYIDNITAETVTDELDNTATAEYLLGLTTTHRDIQEVLTGSVTRKIGTYIVTGQENWTLISTSYSDGTKRIWCDLSCGSNAAGLSNMFTFAPSSQRDDDNMNDRFFLTSTTLHLRSTKFTSLTDAKTWLTNQYNAGTPVIIYYVLPTATTETVTAQTMNVAEGENTITITQSAIDGLGLEAKYKAGVRVTITEVENANLDNQVTVTIT